MEFWIISEGEKEGPLLDFDLRSRIRSGEVDREQKVWYSDLAEWTPLGEVDLFANEFPNEISEETIVGEENVEDYLANLDKDLGTVSKPPPLPNEIYLWRRFGARWFDYLAYLAIFFTWIVLADVDLEAMRQNVFFPFVMVLPWIFLEAVALHFWGTTPGKWLTGLKVRGPDSQKLSAGNSVLRTMRVMILGMGFAQIILREICHLVALWFAIKKKVVLWDTPVGIRVVRDRETPQKWVAFGVGLFLFFSVLMVTGYQVMLSELSPEELSELEARQQAVERILNIQSE